MIAPYPAFDGTQACADVDPDLFFDAEDGTSTSMTARQIAAVVTVCRSCSWRSPCGAYALTHDVKGVWAGTTEPTRRDIQRRHGIRAVPLELAPAAERREEVVRLASAGTPPPRVIAERLGLWLESVYRILGRTPA